MTSALGSSRPFLASVKTTLFMAQSSSLLPSFEKILYDRIEAANREIHQAHSPVYNETLSIEIETLQWVLSYVDRSKQE